jgi:hypothetical protein
VKLLTEMTTAQQQQSLRRRRDQVGQQHGRVIHGGQNMMLKMSCEKLKMLLNVIRR